MTPLQHHPQTPFRTMTVEDIIEMGFRQKIHIIYTPFTKAGLFVGAVLLLLPLEILLITKVAIYFVTLFFFYRFVVTEKEDQTDELFVFNLIDWIINWIQKNEPEAYND